MGVHTYNFSLWGGKPAGLREFKNSHGFSIIIIIKTDSNHLQTHISIINIKITVGALPRVQGWTSNLLFLN